MSDPFLDNCGGWTPAPDMLTRNERFGFEGAYLWGRLRRLCQIGKGTCVISHEALGKRIGMSRRTVIKYLDRLIEDGYVEDLDAGVKNRAHAYSVKKGEAKILSGMQISHTESDIIPQETELEATQDTDLGMRNLHTNENEYAEIAQSNGQGVQILHTDYAKNAQQEPIGMQNLHLKRDTESLNITINSSKESKRGVSPPKFHQPIVLGERGKALLEICQLEWDFVETDKAALGAFKRIMAFLDKKDATPGDIAEFDTWRRAHHWTGNSPPRLTQVWEFWPQYQEWVKAGKPAPEIIANRNGVPTNGQHKPANTTASKPRKLYDRQAKREYWVDGYGNEVPAPVS